MYANSLFLAFLLVLANPPDIFENRIIGRAMCGVACVVRSAGQ